MQIANDPQRVAGVLGRHMDGTVGGMCAVAVEQHARASGAIQQRFHALNDCMHARTKRRRIDRAANCVPVKRLHFHNRKNGWNRQGNICNGFCHTHRQAIGIWRRRHVNWQRCGAPIRALRRSHGRGAIDRIFRQWHDAADVLWRIIQRPRAASGIFTMPLAWRPTAIRSPCRMTRGAESV